MKRMKGRAKMIGGEPRWRKENKRTFHIIEYREKEEEKQEIGKS